MTNASDKRSAALDDLRAYLEYGDTVYTALDHVSTSGMTRHIKVYVMTESGPMGIWSDVAYALGYAHNANGHAGVKVQGAGMDMGYKIVHDLSCALFDGDGYALSHRWL